MHKAPYTNGTFSTRHANNWEHDTCCLYSCSVCLQLIPRSRILVIDQALIHHVLECGSFPAAACDREIREETSQ